MDKPRIIALMGPTASGKTELAVALHTRLACEIISVDSAMVYRGMDIGTAKPDTEERQRAPHRLIDIREPWEPYSAADFCRDATGEIESIINAGKIPLLVGGTMLYFKALLTGLSGMPAADRAVRLEIEALAAKKGWPHIHQLLADVDPESAARIHPHHSQRLSRALEVYRLSGEPLSSFHRRQSGGLLEHYHWTQIALTTGQRSILHQRIEQRFERMLAQGFVEEVVSLRSNDRLSRGLPAMRAVGYRQVWDYLEGESSFEEMRAKGIAATRQLAKRQLTWLRSWPDLHYFHIDVGERSSIAIEKLMGNVLKIL